MADDNELEALRTQLLKPPRLSMVSDNAIQAGELGADSFDLSLRVGPIYDIIRHPDTRTPTAIAIYGNWGTGKTSAMRWLEGRLRAWNEVRGPKGKIRVHPVWFYPWKYRSREDVWRGLISEVIVNYLTERKSVENTIVEEAKDLGRFLGTSFADILAGLKVTADSGVGKVQFDLKQLNQLRKNIAEYIHPEAAYLNEFEAALAAWVKKALPANDRMVIFIDDLDRCMPDIALSVLEALKLYLRIERLVFVLGVDKAVVDQLVKKYYADLGVSEEKSQDYLAKMFQVEVQLAPSDLQIEEFLDDVFQGNEVWEGLDDLHRDIFKQVILKLAPHSPREVKRLVNSSLIAGVGAEMSSYAWADDRTPITVEQGIQVFFVRRVLEARYGRGLLTSQSVGTEFFCAWSAWASGLPFGQPEIVDLPQSLFHSPTEDDRRERDDLGTRVAEAIDDLDIPDAFKSVLKERRFHDFLHFLSDTELGRLMRINYPEEAATVTNDAGTASAQRIVDEAVAKNFGIDPEDLTSEHRKRINELDLSSYSDFDDCRPLSELTRLMELSLSGTAVSNVAPLSALIYLNKLHLLGTKVRDLTPLANLAGLRFLDLDGTEVSDVTPLAELEDLQALYVNDTAVRDLSVLEDLPDLQILQFDNTPAKAAEDTAA